MDSRTEGDEESLRHVLLLTSVKLCTFAATMNGEFLPMQLMYEGKTDHCHPKFKFPASLDVFHTLNHWSNGSTCVRFVNNVIIPYVKQKW